MASQIKPTPGPSALRVRLSFYAVAALFAVPYGALNALNQNTQAVFGGAPGASQLAVARSDDVARLSNTAISASWLISLVRLRRGRGAAAAGRACTARRAARLAGTRRARTGPRPDPFPLPLGPSSSSPPPSRACAARATRSAS